jgi:hypothetical protein
MIKPLFRSCVVKGFFGAKIAALLLPLPWRMISNQGGKSCEHSWAGCPRGRRVASAVLLAPLPFAQQCSLGSFSA